MYRPVTAAATAAVLAGSLAVSTPVATAQDLDQVHRIATAGEAHSSVDEMLAELPEVSSEAPGRFDPKAFGGWEDLNRDGCNTVFDLMSREVDFPKAEGCRIVSGDLTDPYTGEPIRIRDREDTARLATPDHRVSLIDAWRSGAHAWPVEKLAAFFNDPLNLAMVAPEVARERAGRDVTSWLPSEDRKDFARLQIRIKHKYGLAVSDEQRAALASAGEIELDTTTTATPSTAPTPTENPGDDLPETDEKVSAPPVGEKVGPVVDTGGAVKVSWWDRLVSLFR